VAEAGFLNDFFLIGDVVFPGFWEGWDLMVNCVFSHRRAILAVREKFHQSSRCTVGPFGLPVSGDKTPFRMIED